MLTARDIRFYAVIDFNDFSLKFKSYHNGRRKGLKISNFSDMPQDMLKFIHDDLLKRWLQFYEDNKHKPTGPWGKCGLRTNS